MTKPIDDLTSTMTLMDFLAYLFPGINLLIAIWIILTTVGVLDSNGLSDLSAASGIIYGVAGTAMSYFLGAVVSSLVHDGEKWLYKRLGMKDPRGAPTDAMNELMEGGWDSDPAAAFNAIFGVTGNWNESRFYISRAIVAERLPQVAAFGERQNMLRQFRRNSIIPLIVWVVAIATWVAKRGLGDGGILAKVVAFVAGVLLVIGGCRLMTATVRGMWRNRIREVREIAAGLQILSQDKR